MSKLEQWAKIEAEAHQCKACRLHLTALNKVVGRGNLDAYFMIVAEAPGKEENFRGKPFVGPTGTFLRKLMGKAGFKKGDVYMTNVLMCRPPNNSAPQDDEILQCARYLHQKIEVVQPKVIILVGAAALKTLLPQIKKKLGSVRGDHIKYLRRTYIPVWHPSYVLRMGSALREAELLKDLKRAYALYVEDMRSSEPVEYENPFDVDPILEGLIGVEEKSKNK